MKFPITRETLQAFDYAKEQEEVREEVQKRLAQILEQLCKEFKQGMNANSKEKRFVWRNLHLLSQFEMSMPKPKYMPTKDYVYGKDLPIRQQPLLNTGQSMPSKDLVYERASYMEYLPIFIDKLKDIFVGCDVIIDPLKTYLIIDWS
jgi:hypothetical protein